MVHDRIDNLWKYLPSVYRDEILEYIYKINADSEEIITEIDGKSIYGNVMSYSTKLEANAKVEAHDLYVDIQFTIVGEEGISIFDREKLDKVDSKPEIDFYEYRGKADRLAQIANIPGYFTMIFPHEAHRPQESMDRLCSVVKKGVIKIKVDFFD